MIDTDLFDGCEVVVRVIEILMVSGMIASGALAVVAAVQWWDRPPPPSLRNRPPGRTYT